MPNALGLDAMIEYFVNQGYLVRDGDEYDMPINVREQVAAMPEPAPAVLTASAATTRILKRLRERFEEIDNAKHHE